MFTEITLHVAKWVVLTEITLQIALGNINLKWAVIRDPIIKKRILCYYYRCHLSVMYAIAHWHYA